MEFLRNIDTTVFFWLNANHNVVFNKIMYYASHTLFWVWFYIILLGLVFAVLHKKAFFILPVIALMILASDQSANFIKNNVKRYRPCYNELIKDKVDLNLPRDVRGKFEMPGQYGFVSSHAANVFALALFLTLLFKSRYRYFPLLIFSWAFIVSISRIYNGVHYPSDVTGGAMIGLLAGFLSWKLWLVIDSRFIQKNVS